MKFNKRSTLFKLSIIVGVVGFILIVIYAVISKVQQDNSGHIVIVAIPNDSVIFVDGQEKGKIGDIYVSPGEHKVVAKRSGFSDAEKTITIKAGESITANFLLIASSDEGVSWNTQHPEQTQKREEIAGQEVGQDGIAFREKNPITTKIPYRTPNFRIDYSLNPDNSINLIISGYGESAKNLALLQIKQWGFNPDSYKITFKDSSL